MLAKYRDGVVPRAEAQTTLDAAGADAVQRYGEAMDALDLRGGAEAAWDLVGTANLYIQQTAPWTLAKEGRDAELDASLAALARALYRLAVMAGPFIPGKAQILWEVLGMRESVASAPWDSLAEPGLRGVDQEARDPISQASECLEVRLS